MNLVKISVWMLLATLSAGTALAGTCKDLGAIGRFFSVNPIYIIRYDRYAKLIEQAEDSKGHLFKQAVKRIQKACPSKSADQIRDLLIMGDSDGSFCPNRTQSHEIPFFETADVLSVRKVIKKVKDECREPSFLESLDFDE